MQLKTKLIVVYNQNRFRFKQKKNRKYFFIFDVLE